LREVQEATKTNVTGVSEKSDFSHPELVSGSHIQSMKRGYVYIMSNKSRTVLYIGDAEINSLLESFGQHDDT
jgi:hypothetical protein